MWQKYKKEDSGIDSYKIGKDFIEVKFKTSSKPYLYNYKSTGKDHIEEMKKLALANRGLSTYISQWVKDHYVKDK